MKLIDLKRRAKLWVFLLMGWMVSPAIIFAQMQTGTDTLKLITDPDCAWCGNWEFYDFSAGTAFSIDDTATYDADIRGSSNEGVNFGQEFSAEVRDYGIQLLGTGSVDTVTTVPAWAASAPWVNTSWESTGYQPIEAGQLWAIYTAEDHYAVIEIVDLPEGNFGNSFVFKYKYQSDGSRNFDAIDSGGTAEVISGSATSSSGSGFDFSKEETADNHDAGDYLVDFVFVTNEGVNFGNEGSGSLSGTGRRFILLGEGQIDTVTSVPQRVDAEPWVTVTWEATDYQPISVGQMWAVYTREGNYALMEITGLPGGDFGSSFTFDYIYQPDGTRFFDGSGTVDPEPDPVYALEIVSGNNQTTEISTAAPESLKVKLTEDNGDPVSGEGITFEFSEVPSGAMNYGNLTNDQTTDINGEVGTDATVGDIAGDYVVRASLDSDNTKEVFFTITAVESEPVYSIAKQSGDEQTVEVNSTLPELLYAKVTDQAGNDAEGIDIAFDFESVPEGASGYNGLPDTLTTTSSGVVRKGLTVGDLPGVYKVKATIVSDTSKHVTFTINVEEPDPVYSLAKVSGDSQYVEVNGTISDLLTVKVEDEAGTAAAGQDVLFEFTSFPDGATGYGGLEGTISTNTDGQASTSAKAGNIAGEYVVRAHLAADTSKKVFFTLIAEEPQPEYMIAKQSGDNQTVEVNTSLPELLYVSVTDLGGAPEEGVEVLFDFESVPEGASGFEGLPITLSTTSAGVARAGLQVGDLPGVYKVKASVVSDTSKYVIFTINAVTPTPTKLLLIAGNGQQALPGDTLSTPLEVAVENEDGEKMNGLTVNFLEIVKPEGAESGDFFALDGSTTNSIEIQDTSGVINYSLGTKPGDYAVKAYLPDYPEIDSVLFNIVGTSLPVPRNLTAAAGAGNIGLSWSAVEGAAEYNIYRSQGDDNPATASLLATLSETAFTDLSVSTGLNYFYWVKSVDWLGNEGEFSAGPVDAIPSDIPEPTFGTGTIIAEAGSGFSKEWQYFDFSKGYASSEADTGDYLADIRGTSNEGVNFGNENASQIEGNRIIKLSGSSLDEISNIPEWTNEAPWIAVTWDWPNGTQGAPVQVGELWGIYTREGNYAVMEITDVPEPFGDTLSFKYKYQAGGTPVFGEPGEGVEPDSLAMVSGNNQTGTPGSTLPEEISVQVLDANGNGMNGITVSFSMSEVPNGAAGQEVENVSVISGDGGFAATSVTLGNEEGTYKVIAETEGVPQTVTFTLTAEAVPPPEAVELIEVESKNTSSLMPIWTQSNEEEFLRYRIYMSTDGRNFAQVDSSRRDGNPVDTSRTLLDLTNLQEHHFKITVVNNDLQESEFSNTVSGTPYPTPWSPRNVSALAGDGMVELSWSPVDTAYFSHYLVKGGEVGAEITTLDTLWNTADTTTVIKKLANDQEYQFYISAVNEFGREGSPSAQITATPQSAYEEKETTLASLINGTTSWGDFDNDGDLDLLMTGQADKEAAPQTILYLSDGAGSFEDSGQDITGTINSTIFWYDVDKNGFVDLILSGDTESGAVTKVYLNTEGVLTDAGFTLPALGEGSISPADYDNDGDLDFLITGEAEGVPQTILIKNNGNGSFEPVSAPFIGLKNSASAWGDYDNDGNKDLLISGENASGNAVTKVYRNLGNDTFEDAGISLKGVSNGTVLWADFNLDAKLDIFVSGYTNTAKTTLFAGIYLNTGSSFDLFYSVSSGEKAAKLAATGKSKAKVTAGDYDNDGDPDILLSASTSGTNKTSILKNNGDEIAEEELALGDNGTAVWVDYDGDGDLDIVVTGAGDNGNNALILDNTTKIRNTAPTIPTELKTTVAQDSVSLAWNAATDVQTPAGALTYNVRIGTEPGKSDILSSNADVATGKLKVAAEGNAGYNTKMVLRGLPNGTYYWQVQAVDNSYLGSEFADEQEFEISRSPVSAEEEMELPDKFDLLQNYPNPFNPTTIISFSLPKISDVRLEVFDITGKLVATLVNQQMAAGNHKLNFDARNLSSGMYIYRLKTNSGEVFTRKMLLIK